MLRYFRFLIAISCFANPFIVHAIEIEDPITATKVAYTSSELNGPLDWWIINGRLLSRAETRDQIHKQGAVACAIWLMNYSEKKDVPKSLLTETLFRKGNEVPLWKMVSGRPIFVDDATNFAFSFVCVSEDANGAWIEVEATDFSKVFSLIFRGFP